MERSTPIPKRLDPSIARAARAYTRLGHIEFARAAGIASRTVYKLERDGKITPASLEKILRTFRDLGVTALYDGSGVITGLSFKTVRDCEEAVGGGG